MRSIKQEKAIVAKFCRQTFLLVQRAVQIIKACDREEGYVVERNCFKPTSYG